MIVTKIINYSNKFGVFVYICIMSRKELRILIPVAMHDKVRTIAHNNKRSITKEVELLIENHIKNGNQRKSEENPAS